MPGSTAATSGPTEPTRSRSCSAPPRALIGTITPRRSRSRRAAERRDSRRGFDRHLVRDTRDRASSKRTPGVPQAAHRTATGPRRSRSALPAGVRHRPTTAAGRESVCPSVRRETRCRHRVFEAERRDQARCHQRSVGAWAAIEVDVDAADRRLAWRRRVFVLGSCAHLADRRQPGRRLRTWYFGDRGLESSWSLRPCRIRSRRRFREGFDDRVGHAGVLRQRQNLLSGTRRRPPSRYRSSSAVLVLFISAPRALRS